MKNISDAQKKAKAKYDKEKISQRSVIFSPNEKELLEYLDAQPNKSGFLKQLIKEHMERNI